MIGLRAANPVLRAGCSRSSFKRIALRRILGPRLWAWRFDAPARSFDRGEQAVLGPHCLRNRGDSSPGQAALKQPRERPLQSSLRCGGQGLPTQPVQGRSPGRGRPEPRALSRQETCGSAPGVARVGAGKADDGGVRMDCRVAGGAGASWDRQVANRPGRTIAVSTRNRERSTPGSGSRARRCSKSARPGHPRGWRSAGLTSGPDQTPGSAAQSATGSRWWSPA